MFLMIKYQLFNIVLTHLLTHLFTEQCGLVVPGVSTVIDTGSTQNDLNENVDEKQCVLHLRTSLLLIK